MYDLERARGAPPVKPSTFLAGLLVGLMWLGLVGQFLESVT